MQRVGDSTTTANGAKEFTKGQPGSGVDATVITVEWLNAIQRELVNLVIGGGLAVTPGDDSQVLKAIQALQLASFTWAKLGGKPTTVAGFGITDAFTKTETSTAIQKAVSDLVASSPEALDTLKELAGALGNDPNFATTMTNALAGKAAKATTLAGYGITDAYPKSSLYTQAEVDGLLKNVSALPVGSMLPFPKGVVPPGFLEVDHSVQSIAAYPDLAAYLGTMYNDGTEPVGYFRLPESRGEFMRGWDHGRGMDPGRAMGSYQADDFKSHTHLQHGQTLLQIAGGAGFGGSVNGVTGGVTQATGGGETRPHNWAVMWCIKAWSVASNQGSIDVAALASSVTALNPEARRKASPWVPMSLAGSYAFGHGFGAEPWVTSLEAKCVVATTGFTVGTTIIVSVAGSADGGSSSTSSPIAVWHDDANAYARFGAATGLNLTRPADGVQVVVPIANFQVRLKVEK